MKRRRIHVFALVAALLLPLFARADVQEPPPPPGDPTIERYFGQVRALYSGERALEMLASMDGAFRLPGNSAFDASIHRVAEVLAAAGYVEEQHAGLDDRLTYRIERRSMDAPTWEPVRGTLTLVGAEEEVLLDLSTNLNMIAVNSYSTPAEGVEADLVYVGDGSPGRFEEIDVRGKIVLGEASVRRLYNEAVRSRGALGVLSYSLPTYTRPEQNRTSIQFGRIPLDPDRRSFGLQLSYAAHERLSQALREGAPRIRVALETRIFDAPELTLVADVHGRSHPDERFVLSAHVQEPGANDNGSGVVAQAELARVLGVLVGRGDFVAERTVSMVWGDEISSTRRYIQDDPARAAGIRWGMSLDMVGEDTDKTGGTFLIEKMPDPSAIWTRGQDRHTEWWGERRSAMSVDDLVPHYLNDFVLGRCLDQAAATGWVVRTNPYEGGSDHVPFLRAGIPGLLLWHFTDQFYHTDGDRIDKVSAESLANVGVSAAVSVMTLVSAGGETARSVVDEVKAAALARLAAELELSRSAIASGEDPDEQVPILEAWTDWYRDALEATQDIEVGGASSETQAAIDAAVAEVVEVGRGSVTALRAGSGPLPPR